MPTAWYGEADQAAICEAEGAMQVSKPRPMYTLALKEERPGSPSALSVRSGAALVEALAGCPFLPGSDLRPSACATVCGERDHVAVTSTPAAWRL